MVLIRDWPPVAAADAVSITNLQYWCGERAPGGETIACLSYLRGFLDEVLSTEYTGLGNEQLCIPLGMTWDKLKVIMEKAKQERPEQVGGSAARYLEIALISEFPCSDANRKG
jgi:hypothetical protein